MRPFSQRILMMLGGVAAIGGLVVLGSAVFTALGIKAELSELSRSPASERQVELDLSEVGAAVTSYL